ncbi:MAG: hypothetical protein O7D33_07095 [Chloroflexi bacterium]|nr:hypothetical protein [Chloroflexota bacterium]
MPKKSKRVAARQAQLSGRGRRVRRHGPSGFVQRSPLSTPPEQVAEDDGTPERAEPTAAVETQSTVSERAEPAEARVTPGAPARSRRKAAAALSPVPYFKPEIVRVGVVTSIIVAILAVLTVVLQ